MSLEKLILMSDHRKVNAKYELIETITTAEAVSAIERTQEPDETPYALKAVFVTATIAKSLSVNTQILLRCYHSSNGSLTLGDGVLYSSTAKSQQGRILTILIHGVWMSFYSAMSDAGYMGSANMQSNDNAILSESYPVINTIRLTANTAGGDIPSGSVFHIYGVRA